MDSENLINGWSIKMGDYIRGEDDYTKRHKKALRRMLIMKRVAIVFGFSSVFILLMIILKIVTF